MSCGLRCRTQPAIYLFTRDSSELWTPISPLQNPAVCERPSKAGDKGRPEAAAAHRRIVYPAEIPSLTGTPPTLLMTRGEGSRECHFEELRSQSPLPFRHLSLPSILTSRRPSPCPTLAHIQTPIAPSIPVTTSPCQSNTSVYEHNIKPTFWAGFSQGLDCDLSNPTDKSSGSLGCPQKLSMAAYENAMGSFGHAIYMRCDGTRRRGGEPVGD